MEPVPVPREPGSMFYTDRDPSGSLRVGQRVSVTWRGSLVVGVVHDFETIIGRPFYRVGVIAAPFADFWRCAAAGGMIPSRDLPLYFAPDEVSPHRSSVPVPARLAAHGWSLHAKEILTEEDSASRVDDHYAILNRRSLLGGLERQWRLYLIEGRWSGLGDSRPWSEADCGLHCGPFGSLREAVSALTGVEL